MCKIMLSAGEASGDLHGAGIAAALRAMNPDVRLFGMGGAAMRREGVDILYDIADLGVIGIVEVIKNLPRLFRLRDELAAAMDREKPDILVTIDYPGFNMRLAKIAKAKGIRVVSYIAPSVWAWGEWRAKGVVRSVDHIASIFPFEAELYRRYGGNVTYVGHPLLDLVGTKRNVAEARGFLKLQPQERVVLLLPGSRKQEIKGLLPMFLQAAKQVAATVPEVVFVLPLASTVAEDMVQPAIQAAGISVRVVREHLYDWMQAAEAAMAASGTVTLEAALMNLPCVVTYKVNSLTYGLGKMLVKLPYISLPNIIAGCQVVPELVQNEAQPQRLAAEVVKYLQDAGYYAATKRSLEEVRRKLGENGAVQRVAALILAEAFDCRRKAHE